MKPNETKLCSVRSHKELIREVSECKQHRALLILQRRGLVQDEDDVDGLIARWR